MPLVDFIPALSPRHAAPRHLAPLLARLERARHERLRVVCSTPPRHGKTESLLHLIPWLLIADPTTRIAYISYALRFAEKKSRKARELAIRAGVPIAADSRSKADWRTGVGDGGVWATSIGGSITGEGFEVIIVDDPVKDRATAESASAREHHFEWLTDTVFTRSEGSVIVNMARWHEDDLSGQLLKKLGWEHINLPAIDDAGAPLWPERWPLDRLEEIRATLGEYGWSSLYQGAPRPRGGAVFRDVHYYTELPKTFRVGVGIDLAYTAKTSSDWCAAVVLAESDGVFYVLDVKREQATPPTFAAHMRSIKAARPGARWLWYTSTTEIGMADLLRSESGIPVAGEIAVADKFVRAQPVAAAWNREKILLPEGKPWVADFVAEVCSFTGKAGDKDDQVDALAAAFDVLARGSGLVRPKTVGNKFEKFGGNPFAPKGEIKW